MNAFDHLERQLSSGVKRHHAPAGVRSRSWRRPTLLAAGAALAITGGALAATNTVQIGPRHVDPGEPKPRPHVGPGLRAGRANTLALRTVDPAGGPPWTLRVFASSRGGHCVQIGQTAQGRFGVVSRPNVLEPLSAWPGGSSSLCSGASQDGFPLIRGLARTLTVGGISDPRRCPGRPYGDCPVDHVTLLRWGLLGPGARKVELLDLSGKVLQRMTAAPDQGGAYLFAVALPTAAAQARTDGLRAQQRRIDQAIKAAGLGATTRKPRSPEVGRQRLDLMMKLMRTDAHAHPIPSELPPDVRVRATFTDGTVRIVAGKSRFNGPLPGQQRPAGKAPKLPKDLPVTARVARPGRYATVTLSFRAPIAISRFDRHYTATLHGPSGRGCSQDSGSGFQATTADVAVGAKVRFVLKRTRHSSINGRSGWCPGRFTGEVRYSVPHSNTVIGRYSFSIQKP